MIKKNIIISTILITAFGMIVPECCAHPAFKVKTALESLEKGDLDSAESALQNARFEEPDSYEINYNLGIVSYRKRNYEKSVKYFARASELVKSSEERFDTFYNMGNAAFKGYDYALAITAYKNALAVKNDYQADYNLKVAEKKLQEQLERMKKEQEQQQEQNKNQDGQQQKQDNQQNGQQNQKNDKQGQQGQQQNQQQNDKQGQQGQQQNQQQNGQQDQNGQQNQDEQNGQNGQQEQNTEQNKESEQNGESQQSSSDKQDSEDNDNANKANGENAEENQDEKKSSEESENSNEQSSNGNASDSAQINEDQKANDGKEDTASATAPINETAAAPEEDRRDVKMTEDKGKVGRPQASQKARAMKNIKLDKREVEAYLKQMEEREADAQKYYRINNILEKDPAYMNQDELREWMKVRNRKKAKESRNEQDW